MAAILLGLVVLTSFAYVVADSKRKAETNSDAPSSSLIDELNSVSESMTTKPVIVMYTRKNCPPCKLWINNDKPRWESVGWTIEVVDETGSKFTPWFAITDGDGTQFEVNGLLTADSFKKAKEGVK